MADDDNIPMSYKEQQFWAEVERDRKKQLAPKNESGGGGLSLDAVAGLAAGVASGAVGAVREAFGMDAEDEASAGVQVSDTLDLIWPDQSAGNWQVADVGLSGVGITPTGQRILIFAAVGAGLWFLFK